MTGFQKHVLFLLIQENTEGGIKQKGSQLISRVLSWTVIHLGHKSPYSSSDLPELSAGALLSSYLVLLPVGFSVPLLLPPTRCALTTPFHPYPAPPLPKQ